MNNNTRNILLCTGLILATVVLRIVFTEANIFNLAPVIAISLFSGAILRNKSVAYIVPLATYLLSDVYFQMAHGTGFYGISQFFVYGAMLLVVLLSTSMKKVSALNVLGYSIGSALLFWIVSNLGVFAAGYYGYSFAGFTETFAMALPFLRGEQSAAFFFNPIISNTIVAGVLFAAYAALKHKVFVSKAIA